MVVAVQSAEIVDRSTAASIITALDTGKQVLLACRNYIPDSSNPIEKLTGRQYEILCAKAAGLTSFAVAEICSIEESAVKTSLRRTYRMLDAQDKDDAVSYAPMDQDELRKVSFYKVEEDDNGLQRLVPRLSERELNVFQLIGDGLTAQAIAAELMLGYDVVRKEKGHIASKLGLKAGQGSSMKLRRIAGAQENAKKHAESLMEPASIIQGITTAIIRGHNRHNLGSHVEQDGTTVEHSDDWPLLYSLEMAGHIPIGTADHGHLDLSGKIAVRLTEYPRTNEILFAQSTRYMAKEIINQEVSAYYRGCKQKQAVKPHLTIAA